MGDLYERIRLLKNSELFSEVSVEDLKEVAAILEEESLLAGDLVFMKGEYGEDMYIVESGEVGVSLSANINDRQFVAIFRDGDGFGEMNLLDDKPRSGSAHVIKDTRLLALGRTKLRGLISSYPEIAFGIIKALSRRLREANEMIN